MHLAFGIAAIQIILALHLATHSVQQLPRLPVAVNRRILHLVLAGVQGLLLPPLQLGRGELRLHGQNGDHRRMPTWPQAQLAQALLLVDVRVVHAVHVEHLERLLLGFLGTAGLPGQRMEGILAVELAVARALHQANDLEHGHAGKGVVAQKYLVKNKIQLIKVKRQELLILRK